MKHRTRNLLVVCAVTALVALFGASQTLAANTAAGTLVSNTATASFTVDGADFESADTADFIIDRKIIPVISLVDAAACGPVYSGATATQEIEVEYLLTNAGNSTESFRLSLVNAAGTDFNVSSVSYRTATAGGGSDITTVTDLATGGTQSIFVTVEIPAGYATTDAGKFYLVATAWDAVSVVALVEDNDTNSLGTVAADAEIVFADANGDAPGDGQYDGKHSGTDGTGDSCTVTVNNPNLTVAKTVDSIDDQVGGNYAIPGAVITYKIVVTNGTGVTVNGVEVSDPIPPNTTYAANSVTIDTIQTNDGTGGVAFAAGTLTVSLGDLASTDVKTITFDVTVD